MKMKEQIRAGKAYSFVEEVKNTKDSIEGKYKSLAKKLPQMITQNGLLSTLSFLKSKGKGEHELLLKHICEYLAEELSLGKKDYDSLKEKLLNMNLEKYMFISWEAIYFTIWLKRIAEGELKDDNT